MKKVICLCLLGLLSVISIQHSSDNKEIKKDKIKKEFIKIPGAPSYIYMPEFYHSHKGVK